MSKVTDTQDKKDAMAHLIADMDRQVAEIVPLGYHRCDFCEGVFECKTRNADEKGNFWCECPQEIIALDEAQGDITCRLAFWCGIDCYEEDFPQDGDEPEDDPDQYMDYRAPYAVHIDWLFDDMHLDLPPLEEGEEEPESRTQ